MSMFFKGDLVQVLFSKDSRGNSCITFAEVKEVSAKENLVIVHHIANFYGRYPLKAPEFAESVLENSKIPFERILKINEGELLFLQNRHRP